MFDSQFATQANNRLTPATLNVWHCQDCGRFHVAVQDVCLSFAPAEFEALSQARAGCYWQYEVSQLANAALPTLAV